MPTRSEIIFYCDELLKISQFKDYCPNGLQIEGKNSINTIVTGVTACLALLERAHEQNADMVLCHHGYFWKNESLCLTGYQKRRIEFLLTHKINLLAYHLPLDQHPVVGNNVQLARIIDIVITGSLPSSCGIELGNTGRLRAPMTAVEFAKHLEGKLGQQPLVVTNDSNRVIQNVAWCTGAAGDNIHHAIDQKVDAFITGEPTERIYHIAKEMNMTFYACGHHATERYGIQALGDKIAEEFKVSHHFIDIPCLI